MAVDEARALVDAYAKMQADIAAGLIATLLRLWRPFRWWGNKPMTAAWAAQSAVEVDLALAQARRLAHAFAVEQLRQANVPDPRTPTLDTYERGGIGIVQVYERPAKQRAYKEAAARIADATTAAAEAVVLEKPPVAPEDVGEAAFVERLEALVQHDVAATSRDELHRVYEAAPEVIGWRRVIHPELSKFGTCGLCVVAANRFYPVGGLMPLHGNCKCTEAPVTKDSDPGLRLNREDLDDLYAVAGSNLGDDLKRIRVVVNEHGEYGPILGRDGNGFKDWYQNTRTRDFTPFERGNAQTLKKMWAGMRAESEAALKELLRARRDGESEITLDGLTIPVDDVNFAIEYHRALIARAKAHGA